MLDENEELLKIVVVVGGQGTRPKDVLALCKSRTAETEDLLKKVVGLISFEEGPKKSYEKAKGLLAQGNKNGALTQFEECISAGKILQYKNPELKERKFDVAGGQMTLSELVTQCTAETKKIRGK